MSKLNLKVGSYRGTEIELHWSLIVASVLLALTQWVAGVSWEQFAFGASLYVGLLASVLFHEGAHAWAGRKFGILTTKISLSPIGGVAQMQGESRHASDNFWIAAVGPLSNIALALSLWFVGGVMSLTLPLGVMESSFAWLNQLIYLNLGLALFNLIPAFPMDGGRILKSLLQVKLGRVQSSYLSARIGQGFAVLFIVYGVFEAPLLAIIGVMILVNLRSLELRA